MAQRKTRSSAREVNVKHIFLDAQNITVSAFVTGDLNSRKYREVKDLMGWSAPQKRKRKAGRSAMSIAETNSGKTYKHWELGN